MTFERELTEREMAAKYEPIPQHTAVEAVLSRHIAKRGLWVVPAIVAVFWVFRGSEGAVAATVGSLIVIGNFLISGLMMSGAARISLSLYHAAALFGFFVRLGLIMAAMLLVARVTDIDRLAMGVAAVVSYFVLLILEAVAVSKGKEKELEWS